MTVINVDKTPTLACKAVKGGNLNTIVETALLGHGMCKLRVLMPDGSTRVLRVMLAGCIEDPLLNHYGAN